ncbi:cytochrome b [Rhodovibrionaceae bacterium A322]
MSNGFNTKSGVVGWIDHRLPIFSYMNEHAIDYPAPRNLNYMWNFGSLAGIVLVLMIITGILLAMQYTPHVDMAFASVERIMRDVNGGWLIRYMHANGASFFFIVVYLHILRGLYYGSYKAPREILWILGVIILILMMATAFMGYVLPWGQMSFWGATVITNLFSAIPLIGENIVTFLWGGFSVDNPTLNRFFALHYLLPFVIFAVVFVHLWALHRFGSNNPLGIDAKGPQDKIPFHPYYTVKDLFGLGVFMIIFAAVVFYAPNMMGHPDNYIEANPLVTPAHIVPEWYFLPYYAMLRAITFDIGIPFTDIVLIPAKLGGVITMFASLIVLCFLPWLDSSPVRSGRFRPVFKWFFWILVLDLVALTYLGGKPAEQPYVWMAQVCTAFYFAYMLIILPLLGKLERPKPLPASISESVLKGGGTA